MDERERREASRAFGDTLRAKLAASREGLRLEDLTGRERGEESDQPEDKEGGRE